MSEQGILDHLLDTEDSIGFNDSVFFAQIFNTTLLSLMQDLPQGDKKYNRDKDIAEIGHIWMDIHPKENDYKRDLNLTPSRSLSQSQKSVWIQLGTIDLKNKVYSLDISPYLPKYLSKDISSILERMGLNKDGSKQNLDSRYLL